MSPQRPSLVVVIDATPFHRDPVAELAAACKKHGLKFGFYYSQLLADATKRVLPVANTDQGPTIKLPGQAPDAIDSVIVLEIQSDK
jgi:hypothetical protein